MCLSGFVSHTSSLPFIPETPATMIISLSIRVFGTMKTAKVIRAFITHCDERLGLARSTLASYEWALLKLEAVCKNLPRDPRVIQQIVGDRRLADESRKDLRRVYNRFFRWAAAEYRCPNPMNELEPTSFKKTLPRVFTPEEIDAIWNACAGDRDRGFLSVILDTGIRLGEVKSLTKGSIGPGYLRVDGKTGERQVPLSAPVRDLLQSLGDEELMWLGRQGPMTSTGVQQAYRRLFRRAGLTGRKLGPHTLRHTFGTMYCRNGGNVRVLQEIMGHSDMETTMLYVHLAGLDVAGDHALHSPVRTLKELSVNAGA